MPSDDYTLIRGGLKLKGSKPVGVAKKKKKSKTHAEATSTSTSKNESSNEEGNKSALQKALEDEDGDVRNDGEELDEKKLRELESRGEDRKTASERNYEEMRRRRVCSFPLTILLSPGYVIVYHICCYVGCMFRS